MRWLRLVEEVREEETQDQSLSLSQQAQKPQEARNQIQILVQIIEYLVARLVTSRMFEASTSLIYLSW